MPYFFPDTFHEGGDPVREAKENWVTARRAILRKPIDRIGYGGYLKLALDFPEFVDYVQSVCDEFRELYENIKGTTPYCVKRVAVLNCWGKMRAWGCHMVHHALYQKQNYSYAGVIEALSGAPFDVKFISFADIQADPSILKDIDVLINVGDADTAHTGGRWWEEPTVAAAIKQFVWNGGGIIGVGEPGGHQYQGRFLQLASVLGVEKETGFTLNYDKYNWEEHRDRLHPGRLPRAHGGLWRGQKEHLRPGGCPGAGTAGQGSADGRAQLRPGPRRVHQRPALQLCQQPCAAPRRSCGPATARSSCTPGSARTAMWKSTLMSKTANTAW